MASAKALATNYRFCTVLDVIAQFPRIVTDSINLDESDSPITYYGYMIDDIIQDVSEQIHAALLSLYSIDDITASAPWVGRIISNKQNNDPTARLRACQAGTSAICEHFTLTFSSDTAYAATGFLSGGVGNSTITADFTSSGDGDLIIPASSYNIFTGSFTSGDKIFISINKWHKFIAGIAADWATGRVLRRISLSEGIGIDPGLYESFTNTAKGKLKALQNPDDKNGYVLSSLSSRDFSDIQLGDPDDLYDAFGNVDTEYFGTSDYEGYVD